MKFLIIGDVTVNMDLVRSFSKATTPGYVNFFYVNGTTEKLEVSYESVLSAIKNDKPVVSLK